MNIHVEHADYSKEPLRNAKSTHITILSSGRSDMYYVIGLRVHREGLTQVLVELRANAKEEKEKYEIERGEEKQARREKERTKERERVCVCVSV